MFLVSVVDGRIIIGLAACGGFSYGDVLGAGAGWAKSILYHREARQEFVNFFRRKDTFALGVCNGCQMMSQLRDLIDGDGTDATATATAATTTTTTATGSVHWPNFVRNRSEQFEARVCMVEVTESPASQVWFKGMVGSRLPIAVAHGEGRTEYRSGGNGGGSGGSEGGNDNDTEAVAAAAEKLVALRYVDNRGRATEQFPCNPNGSRAGATAFTTRDGRFLIMMPHPERVVRRVALSWTPYVEREADRNHTDHSPWLQMFRNARRWVGGA